MARGHAEIPDVISGRAFDAAQELAGFGAMAVGVFDPALETRVLRAFERLFPIQVGAVEFLRASKTRLVIESAAGIDGATPRRLGRGGSGVVAEEARMKIRCAGVAFEVGGEINAAHHDRSIGGHVT